MIRNLQLLSKDILSLLRGFFALLGMIALQYRQLDFALVEWNLWLWFARAEVILFSLIAVLFAFFVALQAYKLRQFGSVKPKKSISWWFGWVLGILTVGCPACSITLASFFWLSAVIIALPFQWLEIKAIAILLLLRVDYTMLRDLTVCKR